MELDLNAEIGRAVQQLRTAAGMSQGELADQLTAMGEAFHQQTVLKIEKGTRALKFTEAVKIARVFRVSVDSLIYSEERLDESLETQRRFDAVLAGLVELERVATDVQHARIDLAEWAAKDGRSEEGLQTARGILTMDPASTVSNVVDDVLRGMYAELPGVRDAGATKVLELLGWDPNDGATDA